jgi:hypothetical protein
VTRREWSRPGTTILTTSTLAGDKVNADRIILNSMMVTIGSTIAASAAPEDKGGHGELPSPRLLIGTGLTYFGLGILADAAPGIAAPLAVAIAVTAVTYYGVPVINSYLQDQEEPK